MSNNKLTSSDYIELSNVTNTNDFHFGISKGTVSEILDRIVEHGKVLDAVKKYQFYGRKTEEVEGLMRHDEWQKNGSAEYAEEIDFDKLLPGHSREDAIKVYHGIIGKITEAVELAEMLNEAIFLGGQIDIANLIEEIGDGHWYDSVILRVLKSSFEDVWQINHYKLKARFGGKFDAHKAQQENRDLVTERKILETGAKASVGIALDANDFIEEAKPFELPANVYKVENGEAFKLPADVRASLANSVRDVRAALAIVKQGIEEDRAARANESAVMDARLSAVESRLDQLQHGIVQSHLDPTQLILSLGRKRNEG